MVERIKLKMVKIMTLTVTSLSYSLLLMPGSKIEKVKEWVSLR